MKGKTHDLNHDLTFCAHTFNCVCKRSMFRVLGIYNFGFTPKKCRPKEDPKSSAQLKNKQKKSSVFLVIQTFWQKFSHSESETANVGLAAGVPEALWDFIFPLHWSKCISLYLMKILTRLETNKDFFPYIHKNLHFWKGYYNPFSRNWLFPLADVTCDPIFIEIYIFYFRTFLISLFNWRIFKEYLINNPRMFNGAIVDLAEKPYIQQKNLPVYMALGLR